MSYNKFETQLVLNLNPSRYLLVYVVTIHLLAVSVCVIGLAIHPVVLIILVVLIICSLAITLKNNPSIIVSGYLKHMIWLNEMDWILIYSSEHKENVQLLPQWFVLSWMTILRVKHNTGKTTSIVLISDMLQVDQFRMLRLRLKQKSINIKKNDNK